MGTDDPDDITETFQRVKKAAVEQPRQGLLSIFGSQKKRRTTHDTSPKSIEK